MDAPAYRQARAVTQALRAVWPAPVRLKTTVVNGEVQVTGPEISFDRYRADTLIAEKLGALTGSTWTCTERHSWSRAGSWTRLTFAEQPANETSADAATSPAGPVPPESTHDPEGTTTDMTDTTSNINGQPDTDTLGSAWRRHTDRLAADLPAGRTGWDGNPLGEVDRRLYALRESGYTGPIDQDGYAVTSGADAATLRRMADQRGEDTSWWQSQPPETRYGDTDTDEA